MAAAVVAATVALEAVTVVPAAVVVTGSVPVVVEDWVVLDALQVLADNQASTTKVTVK